MNLPRMDSMGVEWGTHPQEVWVTRHTHTPTPTPSPKNNTEAQQSLIMGATREVPNSFISP